MAPAAPVASAAVESAVEDPLEVESDVPEVRLAVWVLVLVLRLPAAEVPATELELATDTRVVLMPTGMPGAEDTNVAAEAMEVTTDGWVVTGRGCEVSGLGCPVTTPREFVCVTKGLT